MRKKKSRGKDPSRRRKGESQKLPDKKKTKKRDETECGLW